MKGCGRELMFDGQFKLCCGKSVNTYTGEEKVAVNQNDEIIFCRDCKEEFAKEERSVKK